METSPQISIESAVADLEVLLDQLEKSDRKFADSLINGPYGFKKRGFLTDKQTPHVYRLLNTAVVGTDSTDLVIDGLMNVYALFQHAKKHMNFPQVALKVDKFDLKIWVQGEKSKVPGSIGVLLVDKSAHESVWCGRVLETGTFQPSKAFHEMPIKDEIVRLLKSFATDPAAVAAKYGKLTGSCSFCQSSLTDSKSLAVGYGPVCAKHYNLPWGADNFKLEVH